MKLVNADATSQIPYTVSAIAEAVKWLSTKLNAFFETQQA